MFYRGQTYGRILGLLQIYCGLNLTENCRVANGQITLGNKLVADYKWVGETDKVEFWFYDKAHKISYIIRNRFVDQPKLLYNIAFVICQMQRYNLKVTKANITNWWMATLGEVDRYFSTLLEICNELDKS